MEAIKKFLQRRYPHQTHIAGISRRLSCTHSHSSHKMLKTNEGGTLHCFLNLAIACQYLDISWFSRKTIKWQLVTISYIPIFLLSRKTTHISKQKDKSQKLQMLSISASRQGAARMVFCFVFSTGLGVHPCRTGSWRHYFIYHHHRAWAMNNLTDRRQIKIVWSQPGVTLFISFLKQCFSHCQ